MVKVYCYGNQHAQSQRGRERERERERERDWDRGNNDIVENG